MSGTLATDGDNVRVAGREVAWGRHTTRCQWAQSVRAPNLGEIQGAHEQILSAHEKILRAHEQILLAHEQMGDAHENILHAHKQILSAHEQLLSAHEQRGDARKHEERECERRKKVQEQGVGVWRQ